MDRRGATLSHDREKLDDAGQSDYHPSTLHALSVAEEDFSLLHDGSPKVR